jgi:hypothetical protein
MAAQSAELSRRIFEDVWNRKNLTLWPFSIWLGDFW